MKTNLALFFAMALGLTSCFKEDERIAPTDRGGKITASFGMTQTYKYQFYYSLEDSVIRGQSDKNAFGLVFDNRPGKAGIFLNSANFSMAAASGRYRFNDVKNLAGLRFDFDASSGNADSLVFRGWMRIEGADTLYSHEVYVIDLGYDDLGNSLGYRKIILDSLKGNDYFFRYGLLNSDEALSATVSKSGSSNFAYFSFETNEQCYPEPSGQAYDLLFTQYTTMLFTNEGEPYPYLVTGVLLNPEQTLACLVKGLDFDSIQAEIIDDLPFTAKPDIIGYDWKEVKGDVNSGNVYYEIRPENVYFVKTRSGFVFKLRFIGFYSNSGEKGWPTIEFQRI
ncbi:MAG: HmuY family protein [Bacteroidales bacterium]|nr:HmuY family protein [Bacteroidales bacterium]